MLQYSPKIVQDSLVMCLDASNNKSYPTDLPVKNGLLVWLDAADDSSFSYSSGTEVSQWRDKSGNNSHANQATTANQPSRSSFINSRKGVNFTSTNGDFMRVSSGIVTPNYITLFAVVRPATQDNSYAIIMGQDHGNGFNGWVIQRNGTTSFWQSWVASAASAWLNPNQIAYTDNTSQIVTLRKNASTINLYSNGTSSSPVSISDTVITQTSYGLNLGYWQYGGGRYYNGVMCEILVFNRGLSDVELKQVNTYLGQKWGISNTDRSIIDLSGNNTLLFGTGNVSYMPYFDFYNKGALKFDGSNDFAGVASTTTYGTNTTWEAWVNRSVSANDYNMFMGALLPYFGLKADGTVIFSNTINSVQQTLYSTGFTSSNDTWYYLSFTTDYNGTNTTARIYINGVLNSSDTFIGAQTTSNEYFGIGDGRGTSSWYPFNGKVSNVKVYNRTLSAAEISQNYEAQKSKFANTIVQQGLVLNLDAGNPYSYAGAGTTFYDVSATALSWTINDATYNSDPIKYFSYNGSSSWLQSSTSAAYDSQTITMECWCYPNSLSQNGFLFEKRQVNTQYSMFFENPYFVFRTMNISPAVDLLFSPTSYLTVSAWNHIVCTYTSGTKTCYVNGVQVAQSTGLSGTLNTGGTNQYIGRHSSGYFFNGRIAESRVYNIALSAAQVLQNYNATKGRFGL